MRFLVACMADRGFLTNTDYREARGVDRRVALAEMKDLVRRSVLVREGEKRGSRYRPGPRWDEWLHEPPTDTNDEGLTP